MPRFQVAPGIVIPAGMVKQRREGGGGGGARPLSAGEKVAQAQLKAFRAATIAYKHEAAQAARRGEISREKSRRIQREGLPIPREKTTAPTVEAAPSKVGKRAEKAEIVLEGDSTAATGAPSFVLPEPNDVLTNAKAIYANEVGPRPEMPTSTELLTLSPQYAQQILQVQTEWDRQWAQTQANYVLKYLTRKGIPIETALPEASKYAKTTAELQQQFGLVLPNAVTKDWFRDRQGFVEKRDLSSQIVNGLLAEDDLYKRKNHIQKLMTSQNPTEVQAAYDALNTWQKIGGTIGEGGEIYMPRNMQKLDVAGRLIRFREAEQQALQDTFTSQLGFGTRPQIPIPTTPQQQAQVLPRPRLQAGELTVPAQAPRLPGMTPSATGLGLQRQQAMIGREMVLPQTTPREAFAGTLRQETGVPVVEAGEAIANITQGIAQRLGAGAHQATPRAVAETLFQQIPGETLDLLANLLSQRSTQQISTPRISRVQDVILPRPRVSAVLGAR